MKKSLIWPKHFIVLELLHGRCFLLPYSLLLVADFECESRVPAAGVPARRGGGLEFTLASNHKKMDEINILCYMVCSCMVVRSDMCHIDRASDFIISTFTMKTMHPPFGFETDCTAH